MKYFRPVSTSTSEYLQPMMFAASGNTDTVVDVRRAPRTQLALVDDVDFVK